MNKTYRIYIRMSEGEIQKAKDNAAKAGLTLSAYTRKCMMNEPVSAKIPKEFLSLRRDISGLCTNVNQIAHAVNGGSLEFEYAAIKACSLAQETYNIVKGMVENGG